MIGRIAEQATLRRAADSNESEFVAVYGRRRIGKTYLVRETFEGEFTFVHSGLARTKMKGQLHAFRNSLKAFGHTKCPAVTNWLDAFEELKKLIELSAQPKKIVFIDEMPWMDTPKSSFVPALENFWNGWASARKDVLLIVCGSATSWIINKVIRSKGGLHNRVTEQISLAPFTLRECEQYAVSRGLQLTQMQLAELYMVLGGVPYYWHFVQPTQSVAQAIDYLFFAENAKLRCEFEDLYASLFKTDAPYVKIVTALGGSEQGLTREELIKKSGVQANGRFTKYLEELEQCGFIRKYHAIDKNVNEAIYQLIDSFSLFHLQFAAANRQQERAFWQNNLGTGLYNNWRGHAFERICLCHIENLKRALQIGGVSSTECAYHGNGVQIDLVINRRDGIANLCEMKCTDDEYVIDAAEYDRLVARRQALQKVLGEKCSVHPIMVSANGLKANKYSTIMMQVVKLGDLFKE